MGVATAAQLSICLTFSCECWGQVVFMIDIYVEFCDSLLSFPFGFVGLSYKGYKSFVQHELEKHRT